MSTLTPQQIVEELDKHIIGQEDAKRKVAIALRNRWRRQQLPEELREEVAPKNIILIGSTGVGKTEIARRLSRLADAPFVKVEASKFTEVGYVGRDCESMIRDLTEVGISLVREEMTAACESQAAAETERRLMDVLLPPSPKAQRVYRPGDPDAGDEAPAKADDDAEARVREKLLTKLRAGELEDREVEVSVKDTGGQSMMQVFSNSGMEEMGINLQDMMGRMMPQRNKRRRVSVSEARELLKQEVMAEIIDMDAVIPKAIERVENAGIVFLDEIDKIAGRGSQGHGPDVSREGVQRDILPVVEGSTVMTKHGPVRTDHILFIAAGAFHISKVSDLIPELQGRFPIRVELQSLNASEYSRILREPRNSLIAQYAAMLGTEGVQVDFTEDAVEEIARICQRVNEETEDIGARRLHTIMEYLLEDISFNASERQGEKITLGAEDVRTRLANIAEDEDLSKYIL